MQQCSKQGEFGFKQGIALVGMIVKTTHLLPLGSCIIRQKTKQKITHTHLHIKICT